MIFEIFTLLVALSISLVSAYFSILGLTAIFPASFWPIIIMGSTLEIGKVITSVWLHRYWNKSNWLMKLYLVPAVLILMGITSIGTFGYLSKSHIDQGIPTADIQSQIQIIDNKISIQNTNIDANKTALKQLDDQVNQLLSRSSNTQGAKDSVYIRKSQSVERNKLINDIDESQKIIIKLQEEKAPIASRFRKAESDVGPIRYVASIIYGDNPAENLLEKSVRWMILIIVSVFDPLAVMLILASTKSMQWVKEDKKQVKSEFDNSNNRPYVEDASIIIDNRKNETLNLSEITVENLSQPNEIGIIIKELDQTDLIEKSNNKIDPMGSSESLIEEITKMSSIIEKSNMINSKLDQIKEYYDNQTSRLIIDHNNALRKLENSKDKITEYDQLNSDFQLLLKQHNTLLERNAALQTQINQFSTQNPVKIPNLDPIPDHKIPVASFGLAFPINPEKGDTFLNVRNKPSKLYKWTGQNWIEIDKTLASSYTYNEKYIEYLIDKLSKNEYLVEDLSETEHEQLQYYLNQNGNK